MGHICRDVTDSGYVVGGAAAYSSIAAHSLGARARVLTSHDASFEESRALPAAVSISVKPAEDSTTFHNTYDDGANAALVTGPMILEPGTRFSFWHWYNFESGYDYGYIEINADGTDDWVNITPGDRINGSSGGWIEETLDLSSYSGTASIRFRYTSDSSVAYAGWYIDDISIGCLLSSGVYPYDNAVDD